MELFRHPELLFWILGLLAALALFGRWAETRRKIISERFARAGLLENLSTKRSHAARMMRYRLQIGAIALLLLALAGPQWGVELIRAESKGTQVMIAVDTSASMLAEDLKPNRMRKAQSALSLLIDGLKGDRVGLIAFAGDAFIQCPLTTDTEAAKSFLRRMRTGMVPSHGTAIGRAISLGHRYLEKYPGHKAMILLTDGEDHEGEALAAARAAAATGIHLYIIGMGTPDGEPIPLKSPEGKTIGYKKDQNGETIISKLSETRLIELAAATSGAYYRATPLENEVTAILGNISNLEKGAMDAGAHNRYKNRYRIPLFIALMLLLIEALLSDASKRSAGVSAEKTAAAPALLVFSAFFLTGCGLPSDWNISRGNSDYKKGKYVDALQRYAMADPSDVKSPFNAGAAHYQNEEFEKAQKTYEALIEKNNIPNFMAPKAFLNLGNARFRQGDLKGAAQAYKRCLLLDPDEEDCRHNLVLSLRPPPPNKKKPDQKKDGGEDKKEQEKSPSDPTSPRPQKNRSQKDEGMSKQDAERILRALKEKEKAAQQTALPRRMQNTKPDEQKGADW